MLTVCTISVVVLSFIFILCSCVCVASLMDASEMVDTYGCRLDEVRTFIRDGWTIFDGNQGDMSSMGGLFRLSFDDFVSEHLENLSSNDAVVFVNMPADTPGNCDSPLPPVWGFFDSVLKEVFAFTCSAPPCMFTLLQA